MVKFKAFLEEKDDPKIKKPTKDELKSNRDVIAQCAMNMSLYLHIHVLLFGKKDHDARKLELWKIVSPVSIQIKAEIY